MRSFLTIIVGLVGGFILGIALSSFIGIIGLTLLDSPVGIKFLPYYTAIICAVLVPVIDKKNRRN
ncbi:DUF5957 family protein [Virgibacillus ndiopensis]|uniref:DUF5957 family protein n=1 Tax=Virgibacillus ndiopensis TaxID=2004408 RepID=UPI000C0764BB|nr:DUF5957 family protein [Virgibacillus ndiopensis]